MHGSREFFSSATKLCGELDLEPTSWLSVKDRATRYVSAQHLFETEGLGTELHQITVGWLAPAPFVLDRVRFRTKLNHVSTASQTKSSRLEHHPSDGAQVVPARVAWEIGSIMQGTPLRREPVFRPCLLQMNESPLSGAEGKVLQPA